MGGGEKSTIRSGVRFCQRIVSGGGARFLMGFCVLRK